MSTNALKSYTAFIIRYRWAVIVLVALVTAFLGSRLMSLQIDMDQDTWIPQSHPYVKTTKVLERVFGGRNVTVLGIVPRNGDVYQPSVLAKIQRIQEGIENLPEAVRHNVLSFSARKVKDIRGIPGGVEVRRMMERIPETPAEVEDLKARVANNPIYINTLVSPDSKAAAVIADFKVDTSKPSYAALYEKIRSILDRERDGTVDIHAGGLPVDFAWFEHYMMQMPIFFGTAFLIIIVIQYWSFRSMQGMLLPVTTALLSVSWALGFMGLVGVHMDGMNTTTPILIMAVAAGHAIQILKRYYEEYNRLQQSVTGLSDRDLNNRAVIESLGQVGPVMLAAGLIAAVTFYTLTTSEIPAAKHFGVFAGSGVLATMILELTFIPALRSLLPAPKVKETLRERQRDLLDRLLDRLAVNLVSGRAPVILGISVAVIGLVFAGALRLNVDNSLKRYSRPESEVRVDDTILNRYFGGTNTIYFLVEGLDKDAAKDPKVLKAMASLQEFLAKQPFVGKTQSIADLIARLNQAVHGDDPAYRVVPDDPALVAQYLFLYTLSGDPQDFDSYVDNDYQRAAIWVFLKTDSTKYTEDLWRHVQTFMQKKFPPGVSLQMGGSLPQTVAGNEALTEGKIENMIQMAIVVFLLSSLVLRSFVGGLFVVTPLTMVVLANFGVMGWVGIPVDMATMVTAAMAVGIGADYELYLLFRFREELAKTGSLLDATRNSLLTSGKAIVFVALSIGAGYAVLLTSGFAFYTRLAVMVVATMIVSASGAIIFLRAMTMIFEPKFIFGDRQKALLRSSMAVSK
ncbi:MAG: efflux RND transporter permease subunit [Gammaproteobacteria bacterium]